MKNDKKPPEESTQNRPQSWIEQEILNSLKSLKQSFAATEERTSEIKVLKGNYTSLEKRLAESEKRQSTLQETVRMQRDQIIQLEQRLTAAEGEMLKMSSTFQEATQTLEQVAISLQNGFDSC